MTLELRFEDDDKSRQRFEQIYNGLVTGSAIAAQSADDRGKPMKTDDDVEHEADLHEAFEAVSRENADRMTSTGEPIRELAGEFPIVVALKQPVLKTLQKYMKQFSKSALCKSTNMRKAVDAMHFVDKAPELKKAG